MVAFLLLRETYPPTLLERKTKRLIKETGNQNLRSKLASSLTPGALFKIAIVRPAKMLVFSPIVLAMSTFMAVVYGYLYLLFTTITEVFEKEYHFSQGAVGLTYLGIGLGMFIGLIGFGAASDRIVKRMSTNGTMKPEYRLPPLIPGAVFIPIGLFIYGWTAEKHTFWIAPIIGTGFGNLPLPQNLSLSLTIPSRCRYLSHVHAHLNLLGRRLHHTRRLGSRSQRPPQISRRCSTPLGWSEDVRNLGSWLGELIAGVYCAGNVSNTVDFLQVRGKDTDEQEVSGYILSWIDL